LSLFLGSSVKCLMRIERGNMMYFSQSWGFRDLKVILRIWSCLCTKSISYFGEGTRNLCWISRWFDENRTAAGIVFPFNSRMFVVILTEVFGKLWRESKLSTQWEGAISSFCLNNLITMNWWWSLLFEYRGQGVLKLRLLSIHKTEFFEIRKNQKDAEIYQAKID